MAAITADITKCKHCASTCLGPTILPCGHVICKRCVHSLLTKGNARCPSCLLVFQAGPDQEPVHLASQLGKDLVLEKLVFQELTKQKHDCLICGKEATKICIDCHQKYCEKCHSSHAETQRHTGDLDLSSKPTDTRPSSDSTDLSKLRKEVSSETHTLLQSRIYDLTKCRDQIKKAEILLRDVRNQVEKATEEVALYSRHVFDVNLDNNSPMKTRLLRLSEDSAVPRETVRKLQDIINHMLRRLFELQRARSDSDVHKERFSFVIEEIKKRFSDKVSHPDDVYVQRVDGPHLFETEVLVRAPQETEQDQATEVTDAEKSPEASDYSESHLTMETQRSTIKIDNQLAEIHFISDNSIGRAASDVLLAKVDWDRAEERKLKVKKDTEKSRATKEMNDMLSELNMKMVKLREKQKNLQTEREVKSTKHEKKIQEEIDAAEEQLTILGEEFLNEQRTRLEKLQKIEETFEEQSKQSQEENVTFVALLTGGLNQEKEHTIGQLDERKLRYSVAYLSQRFNIRLLGICRNFNFLMEVHADHWLSVMKRPVDVQGVLEELLPVHIREEADRMKLQKCTLYTTKELGKPCLVQVRPAAAAQEDSGSWPTSDQQSSGKFEKDDFKTTPLPSNETADKTCPVCLALFETPKILPCAHVLCQTCLKGWLRAEVEAKHNPPRCPVCRCKISTSDYCESIIDKLATDIAMEAVINSQRELDTERKCPEHIGVPATCICLGCLSRMCPSCKKKHEKFKDHEVEDLRVVTAERLAAVKPARKCSTHPEQTVELVCHDHSHIAICAECAKSAHKSCSTKSLECKEEEAQKLVNELVTTVTKQESTIRAEVDNLKQRLNQIKDERTEADDISRAAKNLQESLNVLCSGVKKQVKKKSADEREKVAARKFMLEERLTKLMSHRQLIERTAMTAPRNDRWKMAEQLKICIQEMECVDTFPEIDAPIPHRKMKEHCVNVLKNIQRMLEDNLDQIVSAADHQIAEQQIWVTPDKTGEISRNEDNKETNATLISGASSNVEKEPLNVMELLQQQIDILAPYIPENYDETAHFEGSRPLFHTTVKQHKNSPVTHVPAGPLHNQLEHAKAHDERLSRILKQLATKLRTEQGLPADGATFLWMSDVLPLILNLPMDSRPPNCVTDQLFLLGENLPPFVLTVYKSERHTDEMPSESTRQSQENLAENIEDYTVKTARLLTSSLLNFCCCDFVLLPCTFDDLDSSLSAAVLRLEVKKQHEFADQLHSRRQELSESSVLELNKAATAVASSSHVPYFLQGIREDKILLLDPDWRAVLFLTINALATLDTGTISCSADSKFKVKVAVLEAAKRLSFTEEVAIMTNDQHVKNCISYLIEQAEEEHGACLNLTQSVSTTTRCVIFLDTAPEQFEQTTLHSARVFHVTTGCASQCGGDTINCSETTHTMSSL